MAAIRQKVFKRMGHQKPISIKSTNMKKHKLSLILPLLSLLLLTMCKSEEEIISGFGEPCPGRPTVTDVDGNVYNTVLIGTQCWMKENLKTTRYRDNTPIEYPGADTSAWETNTSGAYAWYGNDMSRNEPYGALYNWYAVSRSNGICPEGWHVPDNAEWDELLSYAVANGFPNSDISRSAGNALKSCRQKESPAGGGCNTAEHPFWEKHEIHHGIDVFGFSALPGGYRFMSGNFGFLGYNTHWWTATEFSESYARYRMIHLSTGVIHGNYDKKNHGFSVRCLRD